MSIDHRLKRAGFGTVALGVLMTLLCELPLLLTVLGLGGLGASMSMIPLAQLEFAGIALVLVGALVLVYLRVTRSRNKRELPT